MEDLRWHSPNQPSTVGLKFSFALIIFNYLIIIHLPIISPGDTLSLNKKQAYDDDDDNLNITCLYLI